MLGPPPRTSLLSALLGIDPGASGPPRVLVSRIDRLGDVVLTLPLCGLLKAHLGAHVTFLGRAYTRELLAASDAVDAVVEWDDALDPAPARDLLARAECDTILHVFPRPAIARAAWRARVRRRVGTNRRAYHWQYCNRLVALERNASPLHEAQLNVRLARPLLGHRFDALTPEELAPYARLHPRAPLPAEVAALVGGDRFTLVLHPRSLGSAREWPLAHYGALAAALPPERFRLLVTGTAADGLALRDWFAEQPAHVHDLTGRLSVGELVTFLARADGVVAASTGPLHIASVLGTRALGIYPTRRPMHPGRWAPIGPGATVLTPPGECASCDAAKGRPTTPEESAACACLAAVPVADVRAVVEGWAREGRRRAPAGVSLVGR